MTKQEKEILDFIKNKIKADKFIYDEFMQGNVEFAMRHGVLTISVATHFGITASGARYYLNNMTGMGWLHKEPCYGGSNTYFPLNWNGE